MSEFEKLSRLNVERVAQAFGYMAAEPGNQNLILAFDLFLDDLLSEDAFGTEGQNDPRGDHRD
jgi:hypothetical protein